MGVAKFPNLYDKQLEIARDPHRFKVVGTGRQVGKTTMGCCIAGLSALEYPGLVIWWLAPTHGVAGYGFEMLKAMVSDIAKINGAERTITFPNGSKIWFKSADRPENLRGATIHMLILDEAAFIKDLEYLFNAVLRPMLIKAKGSMIAFSTPNRRNLFYRWFLKGEDPLEPDWASWSFSTYMNPHLPLDELHELEESYPPGSELFKQEILGEFLDSGGQVFRFVREVSCLPSGGIPPRANAKYCYGIDWGKVRDFTVVSVMDRERNEQVFVDRFNGAPYIAQRDRIASIVKRYPPHTMLVESNSIGGPNLELLEREGWPVRGFVTSNPSKTLLIEELAKAFELRQVKVLENKFQIAELEAYERKTNHLGTSTYNAPTGIHDDTVMALALSWKAVNEGRGVFFG